MWNLRSVVDHSLHLYAEGGFLYEPAVPVWADSIGEALIFQLTRSGGWPYTRKALSVPEVEPGYDKPARSTVSRLGRPGGHLLVPYWYSRPLARRAYRSFEYLTICWCCSPSRSIPA